MLIISLLNKKEVANNSVLAWLSLSDKCAMALNVFYSSYIDTKRRKQSFWQQEPGGGRKAVGDMGISNKLKALYSYIYVYKTSM